MFEWVCNFKDECLLTFTAGHIRDVTARYASQWLTETRKLRTDQAWWEETLQPYGSLDKHLDDLEDNDMASCLQKQPLPTNIGAFKSHPLLVHCVGGVFSYSDTLYDLKLRNLVCSMSSEDC